MLHEQWGGRGCVSQPAVVVPAPQQSNQPLTEGKVFAFST